MMKLRIAVLAAVLLCLMAQVASAAPSVYLKLEANGADVPGDSPATTEGRAGLIQCLSFSMGVTVPRAPGGIATGKRQHAPLVITKRADRSSVLLLQALIQNEACECEFRFFRLDPATREEAQFYTVSLSNARIAAIRQNVSQKESEAGGGLAPVIEEVEFVYQDITWTWEDGGITLTDSVSGEASAASTTTGEPPAVVKPNVRVRPRLQRTTTPKPEG